MVKVVADEYEVRLAAADHVAGKEKEREKALGGTVKETAEGKTWAKWDNEEVKWRIVSVGTSK